MSRNLTCEPSSSVAIFSLTASSFSRVGVGLLAAGEDAEQQDLGLGRRCRSSSTMALIPCAISSAVAELGVVGADHEHDDLGLDAVELAVLDPPEDVLGPVAADAEIGRVPRPVEPLPDRVVVPALRDRIAEEEQVDVPLLGSLEEAAVQFHPAPHPAAWGRRCRALRAGDGEGSRRDQDSGPEGLELPARSGAAHGHRRNPRIERHSAAWNRETTRRRARFNVTRRSAPIQKVDRPMPRNARSGQSRPGWPGRGRARGETSGRASRLRVDS